MKIDGERGLGTEMLLSSCFSLIVADILSIKGVLEASIDDFDSGDFMLCEATNLTAEHFSSVASIITIINVNQTFVGASLFWWDGEGNLGLH